MKLVLFVHSLRSDWNHGNAHFLRGVASELVCRGHEVTVFEPERSWSAEGLSRELGPEGVEAWRRSYPELVRTLRTYDPESFDASDALDGADVALVHEWNDPALVARLGEERARRPALRLLFHDTHHRAVTRPAEMARLDLSHYDAVLTFGGVIGRLYLERGWARRVFTWHEAADVRRFRPLSAEKAGDVVFVGNWGDEERTEELREFLLGPVRDLGVGATVHGVRYPEAARVELAEAGVSFRGYLPNFQAPLAFARHRLTLHVPRRAYASALPGIPTIRPFEALACGIPLVCAPWTDSEELFRPGRDFLVARDGAEMRRHILAVLGEPALARSLAESGLQRIQERHTCAHRVDELLGILETLG